jgi:glycosyltransferase involved in cell wall biosynthesis
MDKPVNQISSDDIPRVCVVIPVLNEAHVLAKCIADLRSFLCRTDGFSFEVMIVDNGSTDGTDKVGRELAELYPDVEFLRLPERGRGLALRHAWAASAADILCYMDVDLSTDLEALPRLLLAIHSEGYAIAVGSRLLRESHTRRSTQREIISRSYNFILNAILRNSFSDAQCGFKAVSREIVDVIVPQVRDQLWFFDTELLVLAERAGYRIADIPVLWIEDDDSRVKIIRTGWDDLKGIFRLRWLFWRRGFRRLSWWSDAAESIRSEAGDSSVRDI